jgi:protein TonB
VGWFATGLGGRAVTMGLSLVTHAAIAAVAVGGGHRAPAASIAEVGPAVEVAVDVTVPEPPRDEAHVPSAAPSPAPHAHTHTHPYPVPPDHDAHPHDPSLVHVPAAPAPAAAPDVVAAPAEAATPRFTLAIAPGSVSFGSAKGTSTGAPSSVSESAPSAAEETPLPASSVTVPARRIDAPLSAYPDEARRAGIEGDVPVEIVVDARGAVIDARAVRHVGYGLDEAAVAAVRRWRFTPAQKDGRAVRVRMTCDVAFRFE